MVVPSRRDCRRWLGLLAASCLLMFTAVSPLWSQGTIGIPTPAAAPGDPAAVSNALPTEAAVSAERVQPVSADDPIPTRNLLQVMRDGGLLMWPIAFCSLLLVSFTFERAISLRKGRVIPGPFVRRFLEQLNDGQLDRDKALELCERNKSPVAEVFAAAVKKWGKSSVEVEQAIIDSGERVTNGLRRYLRLLNGISTVAPLLGLLGTVTGMINAFNSIATHDAMGRPELLASGISEALLTTAAGLIVAIPALIIYLFFVSRVDGLIIEIDALGQEVVNAIASDGVPSGSSRRSSRKSKRSNADDEDSSRGAA